MKTTPHIVKGKESHFGTEHHKTPLPVKRYAALACMHSCTHTHIRTHTNTRTHTRTHTHAPHTNFYSHTCRGFVQQTISKVSSNLDQSFKSQVLAMGLCFWRAFSFCYALKLKLTLTHTHIHTHTQTHTRTDTHSTYTHPIAFALEDLVKILRC